MGVIGHPAGACTAAVADGTTGVDAPIGCCVFPGWEGALALLQPLTSRAASRAMPTRIRNCFIRPSFSEVSPFPLLLLWYISGQFSYQVIAKNEAPTQGRALREPAWKRSSFFGPGRWAIRC